MLGNVFWDWQTIVALGVVGASLWVVISKVFRLRNSLSDGTGQCGSGGCGTCPASANNDRGPKRVELIELD